MNNIDGGLTLKRRMIAKYGSEDAYKAYMRGIASKGGQNGAGTLKGFAGMTPEKVRAAGSKGGTISRGRSV